jgi:hypothetical protein
MCLATLSLVCFRAVCVSASSGLLYRAAGLLRGAALLAVLRDVALFSAVVLHREAVPPPVCWFVRTPCRVWRWGGGKGVVENRERERERERECVCVCVCVSERE